MRAVSIRGTSQTGPVADFRSMIVRLGRWQSPATAEASVSRSSRSRLRMLRSNEVTSCSGITVVFRTFCLGLTRMTAPAAFTSTGASDVKADTAPHFQVPTFCTCLRYCHATGSERPVSASRTSALATKAPGAPKDAGSRVGGGRTRSSTKIA